MIVDRLLAEPAALPIASRTVTPGATGPTDRRRRDAGERDRTQLRDEMVAYDSAVALERLGGEFAGRLT
jgi:hypothetical protein